MSVAEKLSLIAKNQRNIYAAGRAASKKVAKIVDGTIEEVTEEDLAGVTKIKQATFLFCNKLKSVSLPSTIETIGKQAFESCTELKSIILPASVTSIEKSAFYNCASLKSVTVLATTPPALVSNAFNYCPSDMVIFVPQKSVSAYKSASNWCVWADRIVNYGYTCDSVADGAWVIGGENQVSAGAYEEVTCECCGESVFIKNDIYEMYGEEPGGLTTCPHDGTHLLLPSLRPTGDYWLATSITDNGYTFEYHDDIIPASHECSAVLTCNEYKRNIYIPSGIDFDEAVLEKTTCPCCDKVGCLERKGA